MNTQTMVFLDCLGGEQSMWRLLVPAFEEQYRVVVVELIGMGNSDLTAYGRAAHSTLEGHASDLLKVMSELALHDAVFVGHSAGALIGVLAAVREPQRFAKMVLVSPSPRYIDEQDCAGNFEHKDINELLAAMDGDYNGWSQAFAPVVAGTDEHPEMVMELTNSFVRTNPEIARHFARVSFFSDSRAALPFFTIPTLIVQSANDVIAPLAVGHYINEQLADSRMVVVETGGHCPHLSAPQKTLSAMDKFLHHETAR
ncbi:alpha/beta fold hydrolase [Hymenobacter glacialis]|uniref:alpha/beta fold hydrolase n=1 Tax=Hymenobacter glacialis TaxID=1908236 RepID=UPI0019D3C1B4|nr:alpha/beta hydrolase [Hymenobacter glacialis]